ncbi:MAG: ATP-binding protein [Verrucomicrobia bacterium]|nr:ATP-binding protein [Verrucomicrobiota bacterium]
MEAITAKADSDQKKSVLARDSDWVRSAMAVIGPDRLVVEVNEAFATFFGRSTELFAGQDILDLLGKLFDAGTSLSTLEDFLTDRQSFGRLSCRVSSVNGADSTGPVCVEMDKCRVGDSLVLYLNQVLPPPEEMKLRPLDYLDDSVEGRQQLVARVLELESSLLNIHQRWPGIIFTQRTNMTFRVISPKVQALTGFNPAELDKKPGAFWQFVHESDHAELKKNLSLARTQPQGVNSTFRIKNARTGRISYIMEHRVAVIRGGLLVSFHGVWMDITRQMIAEKRLMGSAWKETLAVLTMGLAHDFRNTMAGIASLSDSLISDLDPTDPNKEYLEDIRKNSLHANQLVQKILDLHQGKTGDACYDDLNRLGNDVGDLVKKITPRRIEFQLCLYDGQLPIWVDPVEFRQVVVNLALNAVDAIDKNGQLTIRTGIAYALDGSALVHGFIPPFPCAFLSVVDNGCGIPENQMAKIFEPFYTSKPMNKGTGLGLYNSRLFVERHNGAIAVESTPGKGTTFTLLLPLQQLDADVIDTLAGEESTQKPSVGRQTSSPVKSRATIMLAGKPGKNLEASSAFLRSKGFSVFEVLQKGQAVEWLENRTADFRIILVLIEDGCDEWLSYLDELASIDESIPLVLKLQNCDQDALRPSEIQLASWIISPETPGPDVLEKLNQILDGRHG